jgi:SpoVK/Ycf46/Vps4 family AAA+-type ATPase
VRVMGELLWWLQEHQSRVLTIMTTNNEKAIPPELYREGRIDAVVAFERMKDPKEIEAVAKTVWHSFMGDDASGNLGFKQLTNSMSMKAKVGDTGISPAQITQQVKQLIKKQGA